jgi:DNA replication factor GINS
MYEELYSAWKAEMENRELQKLSPDFYSRLAVYFKRLNEEKRMLERRSTKALLLSKEKRRSETMVADLVKTRFRKICVAVMIHKEITSGSLTEQEKGIASNLSASNGQCLDFLKNILRGDAGTNLDGRGMRRVTVRFLKDVPEIIGTDMHRYGPYQAEDIGSLPAKNAAVLIDKKLATQINVQ